MANVWGFEVETITAQNGGGPVETVVEVTLPDGKVILRPDALERATQVAANAEDFAAQVRAEARDAGVEWEIKRGPKSPAGKSVEYYQDTQERQGTGAGDRDAT